MKLKTIYGSKCGMLRLMNPPDSLRRDITQAFTFANPAHAAALRYSQWGMTRIPKHIHLAWDDDDGSLVFPRGIEPSQFSAKSRLHWRNIKWTDKRTDAPVEFPARKVALNKEQRILMKAFRATLTKAPFGNMLFVAPTSAGKTFLQASIAQELGQRTLVLFQTKLIRKSWYDDLEKLFGLAPRDIGLIQQGKWSIGEQFTLASMQTLIKRQNRWQELFSKIGCLIVDEADLLSANSLNTLARVCPAKYLIGATATDSRVGASGIYLPSLMGPVRKRIMAQQRDTASSLALKRVRPVTTQFAYPYEYGTRIDWHDLTEHLMTDDGRNELIVNEAIKDWKAGESVMVCTKRVAHVQILFELLRERGVRDANMLTGATNLNEVYTEKLVEGVLTRKVRMLVATQQAVKRGANLNPMSMMHLAMPVANRRDLEQLIGRIRRRADDKNNCTLVYYLDSSVPYLHSIYKRVALSVFRKLKVPAFMNTFMA